MPVRRRRRRSPSSEPQRVRMYSSCPERERGAAAAGLRSIVDEVLVIRTEHGLAAEELVQPPS